MTPTQQQAYLDDLHLRDSKKPLAQDALSQLPRRKYVANNQEEEKDDGKVKDDSKNCSICTCDYEQEEDILTLDCFHTFHTECIEKWFKVQNWCPICRYEIGKQPDNDNDQNANSSNQV